MMERGHVMRDVFPLIIGGRQAVVAFSGEMNDLQRFVLEHGRALEERLIDTGGARAAAHHQKGAPVFLEMEGRQCSPSLYRHAEIPPHRSARDDAFPVWKKGSAGAKAQ